MTGRPARMASVWPEMPFMRGPKGAERLRWWLGESGRIRAGRATRRERVLAHPWAAERLKSILSLSDPKHWNGYVPPALDAEERPNDSGIRRALIELLRDVERADNAVDTTGDDA